MDNNIEQKPNPIISVIMPCYNVADTLKRALDSVLMQKVDFEYEIILVNDASTDGTLKIANRYKKKSHRVRVFTNATNSGNAKSFYKGLCESRGDFFCVLDGDDYYTIDNKFQKQIDFFRTDVNEEYVAACHCFMYSFGDDLVNVSPRGKPDEFTYVDFLTNRSGAYYHTSTYLYRNIFRGNVPELFAENCFRGDTSRTIFHLLYSNKKVKVLNFVGSTYEYNREGIWSSMTQAKQFKHQIMLWESFLKVVRTDFEKQQIERMIKDWTGRLHALPNETTIREYSTVKLNVVLERIKAIAKKYAFMQKDYTLKNLYHSEYLDTLCDTVGMMYRLEHPECIQDRVDKNNLSIVVGTLGLRGGGIIKEVEELFTIFPQCNIQVLGTNMCIEDVPEELKMLWKKYPNVTIKCPSKDCEDRLGYFHQVQKDFAPFKTYFYCSHDDPLGIALMQPGKSINASFFSFDHGFILGISSTNLDTIIAKRPMDYALLKERFGDKVQYVPTWHVKKDDVKKLKYKPFKNHSNLITATCAARHYKVDGAWPYRYIDYIVELLQLSGGNHYHIGPLTEAMKIEIEEKLKEKEVPLDKFIQIDWVDNLSRFFIEKNIDVFLQPFPTVTYKTTLEILSCGVPVISFAGRTRLENTDFIYDGAIKWRTKEEFLSILLSITAEDLKKHSQFSIEYFERTHNFRKISTALRQNKSLEPPKEIPVFIDNKLNDIRNYLPLYGLNAEIAIMAPEQEVERKRQQAEIATKAKIEEERKKVELEKSYRLESQRIRNSNSYKLGFVLLWPLRYIKAVIVNFPKMKLKAIRAMAKKGALHPHCQSAKEEMIAYQNCVSWRFGRWLSAPYRIVKEKIKKTTQKENKKKKKKIDIIEANVEECKLMVLEIKNELKNTSLAVSSKIKEVKEETHSFILTEIRSANDAHSEFIQKVYQSLCQDISQIKGSSAQLKEELISTRLMIAGEIDARKNEIKQFVGDEFKTASREIKRIILEEIEETNTELLQSMHQGFAENASAVNENAGRIKEEVANMSLEISEKIDFNKEEIRKTVAQEANKTKEKSWELEKKAQMLLESSVKERKTDDSKLKEAIGLATIQAVSHVCNKDFIEHLDVSIATHCNLKCKNCSAFAPIAKEGYLDARRYESDLRTLYKIIGDNIIQIHLLGGEPLLHPQVKEIAKVTREVFKEARIDITTNGLLVKKMPNEFWETMLEYNISLKYTRYPIGLDYDELIKFVEDKGIFIFSASGKNEIKSFRKIPLSLRGTNNINQSFLACPYSHCTQLSDGKLFNCPMAAYSFILNEQMEKEGLKGRFKLNKKDYIDIREGTTKDEIFDFIGRPIPFCRHCNTLKIQNEPWSYSSKKASEWLE